MKQTFFLFVFLTLSLVGNAQRQLQFSFNGGIVNSSPKVNQSEQITSFYKSLGYTSFDDFSSQVRWKESITKPHFALGIRLQPFYKVPIYGVANIYTSPYIVAELSTEYGAGIYYRRFLNPTIKRKRKYGFHVDLGTQFTNVIDRGFNSDAYKQSIGDDQVAIQFQKFVGGYPKPATKSSLVSAYGTFGHVSLRGTEVGVKFEYRYDLKSDQSGSFNQFSTLMYFRF